MKKVPSKRNKYVANSFHFYFSYAFRIIVMFLSIFIIGILSYKCFTESFSDSKDENLAYEEKGSIDYKVLYLEENLFEEGILNPDDSYMSDVIDDIGTDFHYQYDLDKSADITYTYYVTATMILKNASDQKVISKKEDTLIKNVTKEEKEVQQIKIDQNINLDYDYYNNLAKVVQNEYGNVTGSIELKMHIAVSVDYSRFTKEISNEKQIEVSIPLLSTQVRAEMVNDVSDKNVYTEHKNPKLTNKVSLYSGISLLIMDTIFFLLALSFIFRTRPKKSKYCTLRDGLLRDYDRILVNSKKIPKLSSYNIIDCYSFSELMDAQRLLGKPIIYYEIVKDQKCIFILIGDTDIYQFTLKECDIDF